MACEAMGRPLVSGAEPISASVAAEIESLAPRDWRRPKGGIGQEKACTKTALAERAVAYENLLLMKVSDLFFRQTVFAQNVGVVLPKPCRG